VGSWRGPGPGQPSECISDLTGLWVRIDDAVWLKRICLCDMHIHASGEIGVDRKARCTSFYVPGCARAPTDDARALNMLHVTGGTCQCIWGTCRRAEQAEEGCPSKFRSHFKIQERKKSSFLNFDALAGLAWCPGVKTSRKIKGLFVCFLWCCYLYMILTSASWWCVALASLASFVLVRIRKRPRRYIYAYATIRARR